MVRGQNSQDEINCYMGLVMGGLCRENQDQRDRHAFADCIDIEEDGVFVTFVGGMD